MLMTDEELKSKLLNSLLLFTRVFYKLRNGRDFDLSHPISRECHYITIAKELTLCFKLETNRLIINIPPGTGKSTMMKYFIAWCFAHYPDCQFIYISYSHDLAATHTADIKGIMELREYKELFGIEISRESSAKDNFKTTGGGRVRAFGSGGAVTGQDAGLPRLMRFSGALIMDDMHKPDEAHSDSIRGNVTRNYNETIKQRPRDPSNVPMLYIGQRVHEDDSANFLIEGNDGYVWKKVILKGRDESGNSIHPQLYPLEKLAIEEKYNSYTFAAQIQQNPLPAGGGIFKKENFAILDEEPEILATFITGDTSETAKTYNDPTVFSFWGVYKIKQFGEETEIYGLHWLDCLQVWIEPKDLIPNFMQFYTDCMRHKIKPSVVGIEKKSTGVTLISQINGLQGINVIDIPRTASSGSKADRFISIQSYIARKQISFTKGARHIDMCIDHMSKITANNTHRHDDIADTAYDAVDMALIRNVITGFSKVQVVQSMQIDRMKQAEDRMRQIKGKARGY
jgi:predicted phage terminase large subunit-like protein